MKRLLVVFGLSCLTLMSAACTSGIGGPDAFGLFYSDVTHSESRDTTIGMRRGESCQTSYLGLFAFGDNSIPGAARNGAIRDVYNVSFRYRSVLFFLWNSNCTIVFGK